MLFQDDIRRIGSGCGAFKHWAMQASSNFALVLLARAAFSQCTPRALDLAAFFPLPSLPTRLLFRQEGVGGQLLIVDPRQNNDQVWL